VPNYSHFPQFYFSWWYQQYKLVSVEIETGRFSRLSILPYTLPFPKFYRHVETVKILWGNQDFLTCSAENVVQNMSRLKSLSQDFRNHGKIVSVFVSKVSKPNNSFSTVTSPSMPNLYSSLLFNLFNYGKDENCYQDFVSQRPVFDEIGVSGERCHLSFVGRAAVHAWTRKVGFDNWRKKENHFRFNLLQ